MSPVSKAINQVKAGQGLKVHAHISYGKDADSYRKNYLEGKEPDESPYGFHLAEELGYQVGFSRDLGGRLIGRIVRKILGFDAVHAYTNRAQICRSDVIWVMTENEAFAIALLYSLKIIPRRPIIANAVWLLNSWQKLPPHRRWLYRFLSHHIDIMTVHSRECLPVAQKAIPNLKTQLMYFGVNTGLFQLTPPISDDGAMPIRIFAAGNDRTRDWTTLLAAFGNDSRFHITIICGWLSDQAVSSFSNVSLVRKPPMVDFVRCYREAHLVAVPMKTNMFSGITVALEAAALGKPILSTQTGGVPTYFEEDEVFFVNADDPAAMREAVLATTPQSRLERARKAQAKFMERDYSTRALISRYADLTQQIVTP